MLPFFNVINFWKSLIKRMQTDVKASCIALFYLSFSIIVTQNTKVLETFIVLKTLLSIKDHIKDTNK